MNPSTPEQERAVLTIQNAMLHWNSQYFIPDPITDFETYCFTGNKFFTLKDLRTQTLPHGKEWWWNKSKPSALRTAGASVEYYKLTTRRSTASDLPPPKCKLWIYHVKFTESLKVTYLWCEKGLDFVKILPVTLSDLSFLSDFTTPHVASALGWI